MKKLNVLHFSLIIFISLFIISAVDILHDLENIGHLDTHIMVELFMGIISLIAFAVLLKAIRNQKNELTTVSENLDKTQQDLMDAKSHMQRLSKDFSIMLQKQFLEWQLTESEKEVALLLLKGLNFAEISEIRQTKEKTVRQQASNLYKKIGVAGRHELAAYFFEDLLHNAHNDKKVD